MEHAIEKPVPLEPRLIRQYLALLGVSRREPGPDALAELVAAHLTRIPFENISKLCYRKRFGLAGLTPLPQFLDGIEHYHFGGTCYSNNFHFYSLLASLGYDVKLCGADMSNPDVHMVSLVRMEGREYVVDAGYAAPFLKPLPRDLAEDYEIRLGRDRYVLRPQDAAGCSRLELHRNGVLQHGYLTKPTPRRIEDFSQVIADSFQPGATFLNSVLLARFYPDRSTVIHNLTVIESRGANCTVRSLRSRDELAAEVEKLFDIPGSIVVEALADLGPLENAWA